MAFMNILVGFRTVYHLVRLAIRVPTMIPAANPKANIPIFTGDDTLPHSTTDAETAITRNRSAVAISALFDFIFILFDSRSCNDRNSAIGLIHKILYLLTILDQCFLSRCSQFADCER